MFYNLILLHTLNYFFYKAVSLFIMPLGLAFLVLMAAIVLLLFKKRKAALVLLGCLTLWLWLWSTPLWSNFLKGRLESQYVWRPAEMYPVADAIVSLGGDVRGKIGPTMPAFDLNAAADRELFAAQLYHAQRSNVIIVSGGVDPLSRAGVMGDAMKRFLEMLGVPSGAIQVEARSRNTVENAREVEQMMQPVKGKSILLVTSAMHMPRAYWLFSRTGLKVIPAPTDFEVVSQPFSLFMILPSAGSLASTNSSAKEIIGLWITKLWNP